MPRSGTCSGTHPERESEGTRGPQIHQHASSHAHTRPHTRSVARSLARTQAHTLKHAQAQARTHARTHTHRPASTLAPTGMPHKINTSARTLNEPAHSHARKPTHRHVCMHALKHIPGPGLDPPRMGGRAAARSSRCAGSYIRVGCGRTRVGPWTPASPEALAELDLGRA